MSIEEILSILENEKKTSEETRDIWDNQESKKQNEDYIKSLEFAIKSIKAWEEVDRILKTIMERDKRSFTNQITDDSLYYDGIYDAIKVVEQHIYGR